MAWDGSQCWMSLQQHDASQVLKQRSSSSTCLGCFSDLISTASMLAGLPMLCSMYKF